MSATMSKKKPKQQGHNVRVTDGHWKELQRHAEIEQRTPPQVLKIALDLYFRVNPDPKPPMQLPPPTST